MKNQKNTGVNIVIQKLHSKMLFKNAHILDAQTDCFGSVFVCNGLIENIFKSCDVIDSIDQDCGIIDLKGRALMPAMVDIHCHFRDPGYEYKEDISSGLKAAIKGGYFYVAAMANTSPVADNIKIINRNHQKAKDEKLCEFNQIAAIGIGLDDKELVDTKKLRAFTKLFSNDGNNIFSKEFMKKALLESKKEDFILAVHCQPEAQLIQRDLQLLEEVGGNLHICHVSTKESIKLIREAKQKGLKLTCEVTPHHLFSYGIDYRVNPPFGSKEDHYALIEAVKDKTIDILATDHAPHSKEDKEKGSPGISNIETAFSMYIKTFKDYDISLTRFCEMSSYMPAKLMGLNNAIISKKADANLMIAELDNLYKIDRNTFISKSNNTPFDGYEVCGKVLSTYLKGVCKYDSGQTL
jgi:dihydroorotase